MSLYILYFIYQRIYFVDIWLLYFIHSLSMRCVLIEQNKFRSPRDAPFAFNHYFDEIEMLLLKCSMPSTAK